MGQRELIGGVCVLGTFAAGYAAPVLAADCGTQQIAFVFPVVAAGCAASSVAAFMQRAKQRVVALVATLLAAFVLVLDYLVAAAATINTLFKCS